jgi:hypothetical protein
MQMAKVLIDEELIADASSELADAAFYDTVNAGKFDRLARELHRQQMAGRLTEDEWDALDDVVADYAFYMRQSCGDNLQPGMPMAAEGRAIKLAESALRKILGDKFGAKAKK